MNVLFVAPSFPGRVSEYLILPSLELCVMAAILKNDGHHVELYDMKIKHHTPEDARVYLQRMESIPDFVVFDDSPEVHHTTRCVLPFVRDLFPHAKIVLRGEIATFSPRDTLMRNEAVDFLLLHDDDYALQKVIDRMLAHKQDIYSDVDHIAYRCKEQIVISNSKGRNYKLNDLPYPDRRLYDIEAYLRRDSETIVRSSRGCPGHCQFCIKTRMEPFGVFSVERFVDEIVELQQMGFESFFFSDDTFAFSDSRLAEFAAELDRRQMTVKFTSNLRIADVNEYKISTLKRLGAYRVFLGIETVNPQTSKSIHKNIAPDIIREKIRILKKYNMEFHASFIIGAPGDCEEDLLETIAFVKEIQPTIVTFNMLKVYPGLPYYNDPESYHIIMPDPYWYESDLWTEKCVMGTTELPPETIEKWSRRMLFEFIS